MHQSPYNILISKIDEFIRKYYKNQMLRGGIYSAALLISFYLLIALTEHFGHFNSAVRTSMFYTFLLSSAFILVKFILIPLARLYRLGKIISHEEASMIIGKHFSEVKDKLINLLQLHKNSQFAAQTANTPYNETNSGLLEAAVNQKIKDLKPVPFTAAVSFSENKKYLKFVVPPALVFLIILLASPAILRDSTGRLIRHDEYFEKQAPFRFIINNETLEAARQDDFELNVSLSGEEIPREVYIETEGNRFKLKKENTSEFRYVFKNIQKTTPFRLFADEFYSAEYELTALPNPLVLNFEVRLNYPDYVGKKDEILKNTGDLLIPAGTEVKWYFKTRDTETLQIYFHKEGELKGNDTLISLLPISENAYSFSEKFLKNATYSIKTKNKFLQSRDSILYAVSVTPDHYPSVDAEEKQDSLSSKIIYFRGVIKDDYGFKKLTFNYSYLNKGAEPGPVKSEIIPVKPNTTADQFFHVWDLTRFEIKAGDEIEYFFEVWDNDGVNGSKSSSSSKMIFKAPTMEELARKKEEKNEEVKSGLKETIREARDLQREFEKLQEKLINKKNISWEEKKQLQDLLEKQKQLEEKMNSMQEKNEKNLREQLEYMEMSQNMLEKQQKIQDLMEKIMTDEMKKLYEEMAKLMEKMDKNKMQEKLDQMKLNNKDIEKELDRTLELFKQMEVEQKLQENIEKLDRLAENQEKLSEKTDEKNSSAEELKQEQEKLKEEFKEFRKDMDDMEKKNKDLQFPMDMENTDPQEQNIEDSQQNSSDQLQNNEKKKASQSQKNASEKMQELSAQMKQMQEQMQQEGHEEDLEAMRQLLENLVNLSFAQESLIGQMKAIDKNDPKYVKIGQQQKKLKDDAKLIEDSLFALSKRVPEIEPQINRDMSIINERMEQTLKGFTERNTPIIAAKQQSIMTSANNLALLFDEIVQQMQQNMSSKKFGNASCNKPGEGKPSPGAMKQAQEKLNRQMQKMREQMEKEGNKKEPGKKGSGGMSEQLAKMAAEQEFIRNELRKMAGSMDEKEGGGGSKAKMEELQKLMEETETDLVNKRITQETINRQQEILIRLLESERAEREREMDEKRESREVRNENYRNPAEFFEYNRLKQKEAELLRTVPPSLNPFYRNKVNEYFNAIQ